MSLIIFIACMIIVSIGNGFNDYKKDRANYYCNHYNWLPKEDRKQMHDLGMIVQKEIWEYGSCKPNAGGHWVAEYMNQGRTYEEAYSIWILEHCKAKGIPCTKFIADEVSGVHKKQQWKREAADRQKYGWDYVQKHKYLYL